MRPFTQAAIQQGALGPAEQHAGRCWGQAKAAQACPLQSSQPRRVVRAAMGKPGAAETHSGHVADQPGRVRRAFSEGHVGKTRKGGTKDENSQAEQRP